MSNRLTVGVIGSGYGGNQMAKRFAAYGRSSGWPAERYASLDTNHATLEAVEVFFKAGEFGLEFSSVLLGTGEDGTGRDGTGFNPEVARAAFEFHRDKVSAALQPLDIAVSFFALGKGTGTGTLKPMVELLLQEGVVPIVVVSVPSSDNPSVSPGELEGYKKQLAEVVGLGVRIIAVDTTALDTDKNLVDMEEDEAFSELDRRVQQILSHCVGRIVLNPDQIDIVDLVQRFIYQDGGGYLYPVYGELPAISEIGDVEKTVAEVWARAIPNYFERGKILQRALVYRTGKWTPHMMKVLYSQIRNFGGDNVAPDFKIVTGRTEPEANPTFAVLLATSDVETVSVDPPRLWKRRAHVQSIAPSPAPAEEKILVAVAQGVPAPEAPLQYRGFSTGQLTSLKERIFKTDSDPTAVTFKKFVVAASKDDNLTAKTLFVGEPAKLIELANAVVVSMGSEPNFAITYSDFQESLDGLAVLVRKHQLSEGFRQLYFQLCQGALCSFPSKFVLELSEGGKTTVDVAAESLDNLILYERKNPTNLDDFRRVRWARAVLGDEQFAQLVVPYVEPSAVKKFTDGAIATVSGLAARFVDP